MPRDIGTGLYHYPDGTPGNPGQTIFSTRYNTFINDLTNTLNQSLPVNMGGTGGTDGLTARTNLQAERSMQQVTNFASHVFEPGSWWCDAAASGSPLAGHLFIGTCIGASTAGQISLTAYDVKDYVAPPTGTIAPPVYTKVFNGTTWGAWTPSFTLAGSTPQIIMDRLDAGPASILGAKSGKLRWFIQPGNNATESTGNAGSDLAIGRYDDAGTFIDVPMSIVRSTGAVTHTKGTDWGSGPIRFKWITPFLAWDRNLDNTDRKIWDTTVCPSVGSVNGYQKYGSGIIVQWGFVAGTSGDTTLTFPTVFTSQVFAATVTAVASIAATSLLGFSILSTTATNMTIQPRFVNNGGLVGVATQGFCWVAWGF